MDLLVISNILLWIMVVTMAVIIYALVRQIGILYERIAPAGALSINRKLTIGMDAPAVTVKSLESQTIVLGGPGVAGRSKLLFFLSPDCPVCKTLLPAVKAVARSERGWLDVILASDGNDQDHAAFIRNNGLRDFPYVVSELLGVSYGISKLPYAVLIDESGKIAALGIINTREHLDSLFEAKERKVASIQDYVRRQHQKHESESAANNELAG